MGAVKATTPPRQRPELHLCSTACWWRCLIGWHTREDEGRCRCCRKFSKNTAHELARSRDWSKLTLKW